MRLKKINLLFFCLIALFQVNSAISQSPKSTYSQLKKQYNGKQLQEKVDSLLKACEKSSDLVSKAEIAHLHAIYFAIPPWRDYDKALEYGSIELSVFESGRITNESFRGIIKSEILAEGYARDSMYVRALYNMARFYAYKGDNENAIKTYEIVIDINVTPLRTAQAYAEIGRSRNKLGDFFNAILFYKKGIDLLKDISTTLDTPYSAGDTLVLRTLITQSINIASTYRNIGTRESFAAGQQALEEADSLQKIVYTSKANLLGLKNDLANQYISEGMYDFQKAYSYYQKALKIGLDIPDSANVGLVLNNLAHLYNLEHSDSALYFIEKGFPFAINTNTRARLFDTKSDYHLFKGELSDALINIHKALETNLNRTLGLEEVPDILDLSKSGLKDYTILCLKKKADILISLFQETGEKGFLTQTIQNVKAADELIDLIQSGSYENETKLLWRKAASEVYIKGVYAAQLLGQPEELFYFIEKNKALLLSEEIVKNTAFANLPGTVSEEIRVLKKTMLQLESIGFKNTQSTEYQANRNSLFNAKQHYENFTDSVRQIYPAYFKRKVSISPVSLPEWQQSLKANTTFISYIWNTLNDETEVLIGVAVDRNVATSFTVTITDSLKVMIGEYQKLISQPFQTKRDQERSLELSASLFNQLLPNKEVRQMAQRKKLLIVPDGPLQSIAFETLVTDIERKQLLLQSTDVSYLYSVSFLNYNEQVDRKTSGRFTGYAPVNFKKTGLNTLQQTRKELDAIEEKIGGSIILEERASKTHFLNNSGDYRMIHLATHANASGTPWIAFADEKMQLHELYTYKNNAELVTLSACNTQLGKVVSGEGVLSLSRGFFYSGAKSVMASLWNVDDQSTSSIMGDFYANLNAGQTKSEALSNAKRNYLNTHSLSEQSPYYWSSIVLLGDDGYVDMSVSYLQRYLLGLLLVIITSVILFRKKLKTHLFDQR